MEEFIKVFHADRDSFKSTSRFITIGTTFETVLSYLGVKVPEQISGATATKISHRLGFETTQGSWEEFTDWVESKGHWVILGSISPTGKPQVIVTLGYNAAKILEDFGPLTPTATAYVAPEWAPKIGLKVRKEEPKKPELFRNFLKV